MTIECFEPLPEPKGSTEKLLRDLGNAALEVMRRSGLVPETELGEKCVVRRMQDCFRTILAQQKKVHRSATKKSA